MKFKIPNFDKEKPKIYKWYDATCHTRYNVQKLRDTKDSREIMTIIKTVGFKLTEDKYSLIIVTEDANDELDIVAIPKKWLIK